MAILGFPGRLRLNLGSIFRTNVAQVPRLRTKYSLLEFARGCRGASGSGVSKCSSDPPFHTKATVLQSEATRSIHKQPQAARSDQKLPGTFSWPVVPPLVALGWHPFGHSGCPLGPFDSLWLPLGALGLPSGVIWVAFGCQWPSLGPLWPSWGSLGALGPIWIPFSEEMLLKYRACAQNLAFWNLPADAAEPAEVVSASAAQTPPSTRAGGQDDGSTQTPSN